LTWNFSADFLSLKSQPCKSNRSARCKENGRRRAFISITPFARIYPS